VPGEADVEGEAPLAPQGDASVAATAPFATNLARALTIGRTYRGQFDVYASGKHDRDDIESGRIPAPVDGLALTKELLGLVASAGSYSEAVLLARVAGQDPERPPPPVPAQLSKNPSDPNWEFVGRNVALPYAVQIALSDLRRARDEKLDALSDTQFDALAAKEASLHLERRRQVAMALGWRFDPRDDLHVTEVPGGDLWRRKKPSGYVPAPIDEERGSAPVGTAPPEELTAPERPGGVKLTAIIGGDSRALRSGDNGFSMSGAAWQPKGAIVDDGRTTQEVPVEVDCTGVKIGPRMVITSGHCIFKDGAWNDNTKWIPGADGINAEQNGADPSPNHYKAADARSVRGPWFDHEWPNYDFGLFILYDNASSCSLHWHGWRKRSGLLNDTIHLYGYPGETRDCAASPLASGECHGSIYGDDGTISYAGAYRVRYSIDTQPGQSGTGFYEIDGDRYVLGVHRGPNGSVNDGVRINDGNRDMINDTKSDFPANACD
jgi:V8-like Glu-specific endopeptidase